MLDFFCPARGTIRQFAKWLRARRVIGHALLKQCEQPVDARFETGHRRRDDPEDDQSQPDQGQVTGPIRFVMMNQSHVFLPADSTIRQ
jgi:hypothetical protein